MGLSREAKFFAAVVFTIMNEESDCMDEPLPAAAPERWLRGLPVEAIGATAVANADVTTRNLEYALGIMLSPDRFQPAREINSPALCYPEEQHWLAKLDFWCA
jgi:hypothetical protein